VADVGSFMSKPKALSFMDLDKMQNFLEKESGDSGNLHSQENKKATGDMSFVPVVPEMFKLAISDIDDDVPTLQFSQFGEVIKALRNPYLQKLFQSMQVQFCPI
jgi:hypothetical protein